jgi:hypothetical protein
VRAHTEHNRFWGIIEEATHDYEKIHHLIVSEHYTTLTLGERVSPTCRPAGEGLAVRHPCNRRRRLD